MKILKEINLKTIAIFFLIVGIIGWIVFPMFSFSWLELPISEPQGIDINSSGYIFCGSGFYERVQMYNDHGKFIRGFSTDIGKGRGSLFTFRVENNQLHIHIFNTLIRKEGSVDREIVYSLDGNLIEIKDIPSQNYVGYDVNNQKTDTSGRQYIFKGFLFPRVIKIEGGTHTVLVSTPIYLWFFQCPFPAFAFFFISLFVIVFLKYKASRSYANKWSPIKDDYFYNKHNGKMAKCFFLLVLFGILGAIVLGLLLTIGLSLSRELVLWGFVSFSVAGFLLILLAVFSVVFQAIILRKRYPVLWKKGEDRKISLIDRRDAQAELRKLNDPYLRKLSKQGLWGGVFLLLVWGVVFLMVAVGALIFEIPFFIKIMDYFK